MYRKWPRSSVARPRVCTNSATEPSYRTIATGRMPSGSIAGPWARCGSLHRNVEPNLVKAP